MPLSQKQTLVVSEVKLERSEESLTALYWYDSEVLGNSHIPQKSSPLLGMQADVLSP